VERFDFLPGMVASLSYVIVARLPKI
jgi:hypothetical protein